MASLSYSPTTFPHLPNFLRCIPRQSKFLMVDNFFVYNLSFRVPTIPTKCVSPTTSSSTTTVHEDSESSIGLENLRRFFDLNIGRWNGVFHQFDAHGRLLNKIKTKLSASTYGEDELMSLIQTLYIEQPRSGTSISGDDEETEWAEYKIKEANIFTVDKYQQISLFPEEKAFALRYQTAGMLETVLRQGVLGEDDVEEQSPKNFKVPSRKPSVVCENCLYSRDDDRRARAFHIMDPQGILEMFLVFLEQKGNSIPFPSIIDSSTEEADRISSFLGKWRGYSVTKRSGVYGATLDEAETYALLEMDEEGNLVQEISTTSKVRDARSNIRWSGSICENLITFEGGYQMTLLPGGMYMGCPCDIAKHVAETKSFHLEFCWLESATVRQRLVRTFDVEGLAVSSTFFFETKA